jgi:hypothetical protein
MSPKEIFEFLKDNLSLDIDSDYGRDYGRNGLETNKYYTIKLNLTNPETNETVNISTISLSLDGS